MKTFVNLLLILCMCYTGFSQKKTESSSSSILQLKSMAYTKSIELGDLQLALSNALDLSILQPEAAWMDTITLIYFNLGYYRNSLVLAKKAFAADNSKTDWLLVSAKSNEMMGNTVDALNDFEQLNKLKPDLNTLYDIARLQYQLKRLAECLQSVNEIMANENSEKLNVMITYAENQYQYVPMLAAAMNIKGLLAVAANDSDSAIEFFKVAIQLKSDFLLAKNNLEAIQQKQSSAKQQ